MGFIRFNRVVCVNNEIQNHKATNLLLPDVNEKRSWLCEKATPKGIVLLQLECPCIITTVRIGNAHSAFVEVLVGSPGDPTDKYQTLIRPTLLMNCYDSKSGTNPDCMKCFSEKDFCPEVGSKRWQLIQVVCTQPFNDRVPYGLCFIRVNGLGDELQVVPEKEVAEVSSSLECKKEEKKPKTEKRQTISEEILETMKESHRKAGGSSSGSERKRERERGSEGNPGRGEAPTKKRKNNEEYKGGSSSEGKTEEGPGKNDGGTSKCQKKGDDRSSCGIPFSRLMEDVFFTLSGFKNPERGNIRNQALKMGATYSADWHYRCTHLICACENTEKYRKVRGRGKIVKKEWIEACYKNRKRYPWRRFALDPNEITIEESEEEISAVEEVAVVEGPTERPGTSFEKTPKVGTGDTTDTDEDECVKRDTTEYPMPYLPDLFTGKTFYVDRNLRDWLRIERYIVAWNGKIMEAMNEETEFYITNTGGVPLQILRKKAPKIRAVRPDWIWGMNSKSEWISPWKFMGENPCVERFTDKGRDQRRKMILECLPSNGITRSHPPLCEVKFMRSLREFLNNQNVEVRWRGINPDRIRDQNGERGRGFREYADRKGESM